MATPAASPVRIHVVSHTHWDREWYHPAGRFRQRLVALVDELLDSPPREGESFLLDGQAVVLEDYLGVRPERRGELSALLRSGALEAGPWLVLADELIPGGEALVRNLLAGRRSLRALRAGSPPVLYCPDSFGHPAALPALAAGFGFRTVVLWRGYGGPHWHAGDSAWWSAPGGERVLIHHLPPDGYETGSNLPVDEQAARERWTRLQEVLVARSALRVSLLTNGADHHARQDRRDEAVAALARQAAPHEVCGSSLTAFVQELERAAESKAHELPEVEGELRDSSGYTWSLQGTFASRAAQKRRNAIAERLLVREAEPWAALARVRGGSSISSRRHLVEAAWATLLRCHPHDTLCGCSTDEVALAMEARLDDSLAQAAGVREDALLDLVGHDRAGARERRGEWRHHVLVQNRSPRPRAGVAELRVVREIANVPVGPSSAGTVMPAPGAPLLPPLPMLLQSLQGEVATELTESPRHYPRADLVWETRALAWVPEVPAYGVLSIPTMDADAARATGDSPAPRMPEHPVSCGCGSRLAAGQWAWLGNGIVRVECSAGGKLQLTSGDLRSLEASIFVEEQADLGDLYTPSVRGRPVRWTGGEPSVEAEGPLRCSLRIAFSPMDPLFPDDMVTVLLSLDAGAAFVRVSVTGTNLHADRRLRIGFDTGLRGSEVWADAAFGPVLRLTAAPSEGTAPAENERLEEQRLPTAPLHRYVSRFDGRSGVTLYSDGLAEYEAARDGALLVTLVRSVGELSRIDLPERPGHAGWPRQTPDAQCVGPFAAELALLLHGGERTPAVIDQVERVADDVLLPLTGASLRSALHTSPPVTGAELRGTALAFSALKDSEDGEWLVLRCVNNSGVAQSGSWTLGHPLSEARASRLDETPGEPLVVEEGRVVRFTAGPRAVVTILVR